MPSTQNADDNVRAGYLTVGQLENKLAQTVSGSDVEEAVNWLARSDVRLVTSTITKDIAYFALAHERIIPALRRIAGQQLSLAEKANQLLSRRVSEWLGNDRSPRYLLSWREWRSVERQGPYLSWGAQKENKESLLLQSKKRTLLRALCVCLPLLIMACTALWWYSNLGELYRLHQDLTNATDVIDDTDTLNQAAVAFAAAWQTSRALNLLHRIPAGDALIPQTNVAEALARRGEVRDVIGLMENAFRNVDAKSPYDLLVFMRSCGDSAVSARDSRILQRCVETSASIQTIRSLTVAPDYAVQLGDKHLIRTLMDQGEEMLQKTNDSNLQARCLSILADLAAQMGDTKSGTAYLKQAIVIARAELANSQLKGETLAMLAYSCAMLGDQDEAFQFLHVAFKASGSGTYDREHELNAISRALKEFTSRAKDTASVRELLQFLKSQNNLEWSSDIDLAELEYHLATGTQHRPTM